MDPILREQVSTFFHDVPSVIAVYVFGSVARGDNEDSSDVDVAVLFDETPPSTLMGARLSLGGRLEQLLGRQVDLIVLITASADLVHRVLRDGDLIVERHRGRRIRFEVTRRNEYFDMQRIWDEYRRITARRPA